MQQHLRNRPPPFAQKLKGSGASVPAAVEKVLLTALEKSAAERFADAGQFRQALESVLPQLPRGSGATMRRAGKQEPRGAGARTDGADRRLAPARRSWSRATSASRRRSSRRPLVTTTAAVGRGGQAQAAAELADAARGRRRDRRHRRALRARRPARAVDAASAMRPACASAYRAASSPSCAPGWRTADVPAARALAKRFPARRRSTSSSCRRSCSTTARCFPSCRPRRQRATPIATSTRSARCS